MLKSIVVAPITTVSNLERIDFNSVSFDFNNSENCYFGVIHEECFISLHDKTIYPIIAIDESQIDDKDIDLLENNREYVFTDHMLEIDCKNMLDLDKMKLIRLSREAIEYYDYVKKEVLEQQKSSNIVQFRK